MPKKIKVLHVTFDMTFGGTQQVIRQLVENLDAGLVKNEVVCIDNTLGELGEDLKQKGIKIHLLDRRTGIDFKLIKLLYKLIRAEHYHIVHCHQYSPYVYGFLASLFLPARVIFTEHGRFYPDRSSWKRKLINPLFSLFTYKITAISEATKKALIQFENFSAEKIEVIYNGIRQVTPSIEPDAIRQHYGIPSSRFIFGTISRLQPIKNQKMMIRAFYRAQKQYAEMHLLLVGDGEIRGELEALVDLLRLSDKVTFTGFQHDPENFHKVIDVFLLSSFSEGTSMTLLEAMSLKKPCIVTNVGGNPEIITDGENGFVVDSGDEAGFSLAMTALFENPQRVKLFGESGFKVFINKFSVENMLESFTKLYISSITR